MTGSMHGSDVDQLHALAQRMDAAALQLDLTRKLIRARLYSCGWDGSDAAQFRRQWEGQLQGLLSSNATYLRSSSQQLLREAEQQTAASRDGAAAMLPWGDGRSLLSAAHVDPSRFAKLPDERLDLRGAVGVLGFADDLVMASALAMWAVRSPLTWQSLLNSSVKDVSAAAFRNSPGLLPGLLSKAIGGAGIAFSVFEAGSAFASGDNNKGIRSTISAGLGAAMFIPGSQAVTIPLNIAWTVGNIAYEAHQEKVDRFVTATLGRAVDHVVQNPTILLPAPVQVGLGVGKAALSLVDSPDDPLRKLASKFF